MDESATLTLSLSIFHFRPPGFVGAVLDKHRNYLIKTYTLCISEMKKKTAPVASSLLNLNQRVIIFVANYRERKYRRDYIAINRDAWKKKARKL